jgi:hypothetical protein
VPITELEAALYDRKNKTNKIALLHKVKAFLDSIERNSIKSKRSYSSGLSLLVTKELFKFFGNSTNGND